MNAACIKFFLPVLLLVHAGQSHGQDISDDPGYRQGETKSVRLHREEWNLSYPIISLGSDEKLVLHFDLLGDNVETYYYSFTHCDKDWNPSGVFESEYLQGFVENRVEDYDMSFNTTVNYIHYSLSFPNSDVSFKISGNYIISVYPFGEPDRPVVTKRFMVSENTATIDATTERSKLTDFYLTGQQLDFIVDHSGLRLQDPYNYVNSTILKNGRWDNARTNLKPAFTGNDRLDYNSLSDIGVFPGGNEYRYFDIRSLRYQSEYVRKIENINGYYHVLLKESDNRAARGYFYNPDFNGKYYIDRQEGINPHTDADYVYVYFTLPAAFPLDRDVYVFGELTDWELSEKNRMEYNTETHSYECRLLLKQGWYNYIYAVPDDRPLASVFNEFEGDYYETENDYIILVYYRDPGGRYDRLIGHHILNNSGNRP